MTEDIPKIFYSVLRMVNEKIANAFMSQVKEVQFEFVSFLPCQRKDKVCLGRLIANANPPKIQLVLRLGWPNTAIHEIVHLYDPSATEKKVETLSLQVTKYLKSLQSERK